MFFDGFPRDAHPMPVLSSAVSALSTFYQDSLDPFDPEHVEISTIRLLAKLPTIAAYAYKKSIGQPLLYPDNTLSLTENFLRMTFGVPAVDYEIDPIMVKALEQLLVLHADHEQNCSTSTVRLVGSSHANLFASVSAGINALFGPLHGGANQAVLEMLKQIQADGGNIDHFINRVKNREPGVKLMGFGHRVYKNYDPRAAIIKETADTILRRSGMVDPLLDIALQLEQRALHDDYFAERKLYPNVDFYTGLIYKSMGFPNRMFTVLFALGRLPGWIAQWREMMVDPTTKIGRPRQVYIGESEREYLSIKKRGGVGAKLAKEEKARLKAEKEAARAAKAEAKALAAAEAAEKAKEVAALAEEAAQSAEAQAQEAAHSAEAQAVTVPEATPTDAVESEPTADVH
jgi:citrate synthase